MLETTIPNLPQLTRVIESAWNDLQSFLADLNERQASLSDDKGWTIGDHVTHMAVWEDSVAILFRGKRRHEALGIDEATHATSSFDQINEIIRERHKNLSFTEALQRLEKVHGALMERVTALSDADLRARVCDFFPLAPRTDERQVTRFIFENTAGHFAEHLQWMRSLVARAPDSSL